MISHKAKYALRALIALAEADPDKALLISDIAESQSIPRRFLEQILLDLKHHGLVMSRRGKYGGYVLLKPAEEIRFSQVLRMIDGPIAPLPCLSRMAYRRCDDCENETTCQIRGVFAEAHDALLKILENHTIADACVERKDASGDGLSQIPRTA